MYQTIGVPPSTEIQTASIPPTRNTPTTTTPTPHENTNEGERMETDENDHQTEEGTKKEEEREIQRMKGTLL